MIETLFGTIFGGVFRLAPEVLKWLDRKNERQHELAMADKQAQSDLAKGDQAQQLAATQASAAVSTAEVQAMTEATRAQGTLTGVRWADALNASIRPLLALQWLILLWPAVIAGGFIMAIQAGISPLTALDEAFGIHEQTLASSIASFWLVDRSLRHTGK